MSLSAVLRDIAAPHKAPPYSVTTVELHGVKFDCLYEVEGEDIPATHDTPAEHTYAVLFRAYIGGCDVTELVEERGIQADLEQAIEKQELRAC